MATKEQTYACQTLKDKLDDINTLILEIDDLGIDVAVKVSHFNSRRMASSLPQLSITNLSITEKL